MSETQSVEYKPRMGERLRLVNPQDITNPALLIDMLDQGSRAKVYFGNYKNEEFNALYSDSIFSMEEGWSAKSILKTEVESLKGITEGEISLMIGDIKGDKLIYQGGRNE